MVKYACTQLNELSICSKLNHLLLHFTTVVTGLTVPYARTDIYKFLFVPFTCANWNKLPKSIKDIELVDRFKLYL